MQAVILAEAVRAIVIVHIYPGSSNPTPQWNFTEKMFGLASLSLLVKKIFRTGDVTVSSYVHSRVRTPFNYTIQQAGNYRSAHEYTFNIQYTAHKSSQYEQKN